MNIKILQFQLQRKTVLPDLHRKTFEHNLYSVRVAIHSKDEMEPIYHSVVIKKSSST